MSAPGEFHPIIVAPTFDNARTLEEVLQQLLDLGLPLIAVDDGCRDDSPQILARLAGASDRLTVVTHASNQGKAAALLTGFRRATEMGFSHAITIDTDGQLDPSQVADLSRAARQSPDALLVGTRDAAAADYPSASRVGRAVTNLLLRWESGARVSDSQCGFRVYPLRATLALPCRASRYGFETEVLARAAWAGIPLGEVPVRCRYYVPTGRVTHFRKWRDSFAGVALHLRLIARTLTPWPVRRIAKPDDADYPTGTAWARLVRWINPARAWRAIRHDPRERSRFAAGLAAGVFIANLPLYGVQTLLSLVVARRFRLHPMPVVVGSHLATPPVGPLLIAAAITLGHWMIHGALPTWRTFDPATHGYVATLRAAFVEWSLGGITVGALLAAATFLTARLALRLVPPPLPPRTATTRAAHATAPAPAPDREAEESVA